MLRREEGLSVAYTLILLIVRKECARAFPRCSRATCASYKNAESRRWESSFARVTTGLRVKGPPANQLPKQRPKLIFPSSSATVSVVRVRARAREMENDERGRVMSLDVRRCLMEDRLPRRHARIHTSRHKVVQEDEYLVTYRRCH